MKVKAKYKVCRRLGPGIYEKCQTEKFALAQSRKQALSKMGGRRRRNVSQYGLQLLEKQKVRFTYGVNEKQFHNYVKEALRSKDITPAERLYQMLEVRLDNVVFRMGLAPTRQASRQMVSHGHILVNGKRMKVPSYTVTEKDVLTIREGSRDSGLFAELAETLGKHTAPAWLNFDAKKWEGKKLANPELDDTTGFDLTSVIEFYSR